MTINPSEDFDNERAEREQFIHDVYKQNGRVLKSILLQNARKIEYDSVNDEVHDIYVRAMRALRKSIQKIQQSPETHDAWEAPARVKIEDYIRKCARTYKNKPYILRVKRRGQELQQAIEDRHIVARDIADTDAQNALRVVWEEISACDGLNAEETLMLKLHYLGAHLPDSELVELCRRTVPGSGTEPDIVVQQRIRDVIDRSLASVEGTEVFPSFKAMQQIGIDINSAEYRRIFLDAKIAPKSSRASGKYRKHKKIERWPARVLAALLVRSAGICSDRLMSGKRKLREYLCLRKHRFLGGESEIRKVFISLRYTPEGAEGIRAHPFDHQAYDALLKGDENPPFATSVTDGLTKDESRVFNAVMFLDSPCISRAQRRAFQSACDRICSIIRPGKGL